MSYINIKVKDSTENKDGVKSENNKKQIEDGDLYLAIIMARYILEERQRLIKNYYNNKENNNDK